MRPERTGYQENRHIFSLRKNHSSAFTGASGALAGASVLTSTFFAGGALSAAASSSRARLLLEVEASALAGVSTLTGASVLAEASLLSLLESSLRSRRLSWDLRAFQSFESSSLRRPRPRPFRPRPRLSGEGS